MGSIDRTIASYTLHLQAGNKSPKTVRTYTDAVIKMAAETGKSQIAIITRQDVERHIVSLLDRYSDSYASNQFRALQQFFNWYSQEEEIPNPMAGMTGPSVGSKAVPVLSGEDMTKLLRACSGRSWKARRDTAIILMFRDTGCRLAELAGLTGEDIDLRLREALVTGKGNRQRHVKFGAETALAIDRYLRVRSGKDGSSVLFGMLPNGHYQMIKRRGAQAGVTVHPHQMRHTFAHNWLDRGGAEGDLMQLAGWRSAQMLRRYGASAASARARRSYDKIMSA